MTIDCHVHPNIEVGGSLEAARRELARGLDVLASEGVDACAGSLIPPLYSNCSTHREYNDLLAALAQSDERFIPSCVVNPREPDAAEEIARCHERYGMVSLKLHPWLQGISCSDPYMAPVFEACAEHGVSVIFHDGTPPYASSLQCADAARRYPELVVVLGHAGLNDQWRQARDIACELPNVYVGLCGPSVAALQNIVDVCPADRLLYGSDYTWVTPSTIRYRLHKVQALKMDDRTRALVLSGNALRLFGRS